MLSNTSLDCVLVVRQMSVSNNSRCDQVKTKHSNINETKSLMFERWRLHGSHIEIAKISHFLFLYSIVLIYASNCSKESSSCNLINTSKETLPRNRAGRSFAFSWDLITQDCACAHSVDTGHPICKPETDNDATEI